MTVCTKVTFAGGHCAEVRVRRSGTWGLDMYDHPTTVSAAGHQFTEPRVGTQWAPLVSLLDEQTIEPERPVALGTVTAVEPIHRLVVWQAHTKRPARSTRGPLSHTCTVRFSRPDQRAPERRAGRLRR